MPALLELTLRQFLGILVQSLSSLTVRRLTASGEGSPASNWQERR